MPSPPSPSPSQRGMTMPKWLGRIVCFFTQHIVYIEDIELRDENAVNDRVWAACDRCGKTLWAHCGLSLNAELRKRGGFDPHA